MNDNFFDLAGQVLDHTIVDADDYPCGKVDDIEIEGDIGKPLRVRALLVGPGFWTARMPRCLRALARKIAGDEKVRVPWEEVEEITPKVKLRSRASALGLGKADRRAGRRMGRVVRS